MIFGLEQPWGSLLVVAIGMAIVIGGIVWLRVHAFLALIAAALVVSFCVPVADAGADPVVRVANAFGAMAGGIGIVIALAAVIGACMTESGAADRIVRAFLGALGERRAGTALASSAYVLGIPVFFDTVFYLLVPLARSTFRRTGRGYLKCLLAVTTGGIVTHALVPPTPGPVAAAYALGVDLGVMLLVGMLVALPSAIVGLAFASWLDRRVPVQAASADVPAEAADLDGPSLAWSVAPIAVPVALIAMHTVASNTVPDTDLVRWTAVLGNPNVALAAAATLALVVFMRQRGAGRAEMSTLVERALMSAGVIILITAAGGAFGKMLQGTGIGAALEQTVGSAEHVGQALLWLAFGLAALMKIAQGSSTVAMITTSAILAGMIGDHATGCHLVYVATAVGAGSLVGSWMNDSGFWVFARMGGLTELETLRSWTPLLAVVGMAAMLTTCVLAALLPLQ